MATTQAPAGAAPQVGRHDGEHHALRVDVQQRRHATYHGYGDQREPEVADKRQQHHAEAEHGEWWPCSSAPGGPARLWAAITMTARTPPSERAALM